MDAKIHNSIPAKLLKPNSRLAALTVAIRGQGVVKKFFIFNHTQSKNLTLD
jgi:hypothetical protein